MTQHLSQDHYRQFFENSADAILIIHEGTFVDCNQATVKMLRYRNKDELLQTHPSELSPEYQPDGRPSFEKADEMMALAVAKGSHRFEWAHMRGDGSVFPVEVLLTPINLDERQVIHVVWRDITERKRLEADLRHSQKIEALGRLTGGIAHDFNNLLMGVIGYSEMLQDDLGPQHPGQDYLDNIQQAANRASRLVRQLLAYSRKQHLEPHALELNDLLDDLEAMLIPVLGEEIRLRTALRDSPLHIWADPGQLEQVVVNLATNARDAMGGQGQITIETSRVDWKGGQVGLNGRLDAGRYACLKITDTGEGIPPENQNRVFDPFFTTKPVDRGTGLGLSMVQGIIRQSGGEVVVGRSDESGSVFEVYLPLSSKVPIPASTLAIPSERAAVCGETILFAEDEGSVSSLVARRLRREGYVVHTAGNGLEALELIKSLDLKPDLLLSDVVMPEMGGAELARRLTEIQPHLKVVFLSGYSEDDLDGHLGQDHEHKVLQKPISMDSLLCRLREILA